MSKVRRGPKCVIADWTAGPRRAAAAAAAVAVWRTGRPRRGGRLWQGRLRRVAAQTAGAAYRQAFRRASAERRAPSRAGPSAEPSRAESSRAGHRGRVTAMGRGCVAVDDVVAKRHVRAAIDTRPAHVPLSRGCCDAPLVSWES